MLMKKLLMYFAVFAMSWLSGTAAAEDYLMPQYGYDTKVVSKDAPITFYDFKGADTHFTQSAFSTVIFKPATEGYSIKISFEELNLTKYSDSWNVYMRIYNGQYVTPLPTYISGSADGCLSVCLYSKDPSPKESYWKATVEEVLLESMTVKAASGNNDFVDGEIWAGKQGVGVAGFGITTEGYSSPDKLQSVTFTCTNAAVIDATALKLYAGQSASVAGLTEVAGTITESEGVYTYTLTDAYALSNGANLFCLGGDVMTSAAFNATASVNVTGIATAGGFTAFTSAAAVTLTVQPMYLMATDATYSIAQDTKFYDEGGKDGNVVKGFDGKVVFAPATEGKKVQLTFKDRCLLHRLCSQLYGVCRLYQGV